MSINRLLRQAGDLAKRIRPGFAVAFGFVVISREYGAMHACFDYDEAIGWMKCYPGTDLLFHGTLLARNQLFPLGD